MFLVVTVILADVGALALRGDDNGRYRYVS